MKLLPSVLFIICNIPGLSKGALLRVNGTKLEDQAMRELVRKYGYPLDTHVDIRTDDGYLLTMQRIPHGRFENNTRKMRPPVLFMHGLLTSAESWLLNGPDHSMPFLLADLGFDVWLANARGTTRSRKHEHLDPDKDSRFWQFSWHEIGVYDTPALIDYVRQETKEDKIIYIGHSQGTTSYFVMGSERPKYNKHVKLMVALAPVVYVSNIKDPVSKFMAQFESGLDVVTTALGVNEYMPNNDLLSVAGKNLCQNVALVNDICTNMLFLISGYDSKQMNKSAIPLIMKYTPAGASMKQLIHFAQLVNSGEFRQYDFGLIQNIMKYATPAPPNYNLSKIKTPVAIFYARNDDLASEMDMKRLLKHLPNVVKKYLITYDLFTHLDFLWGNEAKSLLYSHVIKLLRDY